MVREELVAGIQNAVIRGESIEQAIQTLVYSGYDPKEVQEAADTLNMGILNQLPKKIEENRELRKTITEKRPEEVQQIKQPQPAQQVQAKEETKQEYKSLPQQNQQSQPTTPKKRLSKGFIILLVILLLLILGLIGFSFFGQKILEALFPQVATPAV